MASKEYMEAYRRRYRQTTKGRALILAARKRWKQSENGREANRKWAQKAYRWEHHLKKAYGLSAEQYEAMAVGGCQICGAKKSHGKRSRLHVDHDHATGKVRGILCDRCNIGLGGFQDDVTKLLSALNYLRRS